MSRIIAIIENGTVVNAIVADSWPDGIDITDITPRPGIGWSYDGQAFTAPPAPPPPEPQPVQTTPYMSHFGFLSRLTPQQRLSIRERTDKTSPLYDPILDDAMFLFNSAERIDVTLTTTQNLVGYMAQQGLIDASDIPSLLAEIEVTSPHAKP